MLDSTAAKTAPGNSGSALIGWSSFVALGDSFTEGGNVNVRIWGNTFSDVLVAR